MSCIWGEDMWQLFLLLFTVCPQHSVEASLTLCDSPQSYLEVEEGKQDNTFTCSGLKQTESVEWYLEYPNQPAGTIFIGTCYTNLSCSVQVKAIFNLRRTTETSVITVNETAILNKNSFTTATFLCQTFLQKSKTDETRCQVDYIYPAENIICKTEFSGKIWRLTGQCDISKVYSSRNNYGCYLYQTIEGSQELTVGFYSMDLRPSTASKYVSGTCNMTSFLPPIGQYTYTVIVIPGKVKVPATFNGNNTIRQPPVSPVHNCPVFVNEGDTVDCKCSVSDVGSPPGRIAWNTGSDQLLLTGVKKEQHGMTFVCGVTWNNTVYQPVTYTLLIAYRPSALSIQLNNITSDRVTVEEKSSLTMLCQSDGRPTPNMTITYVTSDNRVLNSRPGGNVTLAAQNVSIQHKLVDLQCEDSGYYNCSANNNIGSKYHTVELIVKCKPVRVDASPTPPIIVEGNTRSFELIAYPNSVNVTKYFIGSNNCSSETPASDNVLRVACTPNSQLLYKITCAVTVIKLTLNAAGLYEVVVSNDLGRVTLIFEALPQNTPGSDDVTSSEFSRGLGTGLGIGLGIAAAEAVGVVLVCWWRRKQQTTHAKGRRENTGYSSRQDISLEKIEEPSLSSGREHESAYEAIGTRETGQTAPYTNVQGSQLSLRETTNKTGNVYDGLHVQDVGVSSPYASLT